MSEIRVPEGLWDTGATPEGVVINWFFGDGDAVSAGAVVAEIMVAKTQYQIESPAAGRLRIEAPVDAVVVPGAVIGAVDG